MRTRGLLTVNGATGESSLNVQGHVVEASKSDIAPVLTLGQKTAENIARETDTIMHHATSR